MISEYGVSNCTRFWNRNDSGYNMLFQAGENSDYVLHWSVVGVKNNELLTWNYVPSVSLFGPNRETSALELYRGCDSCKRRLYMAGPSALSGAGETVINSEGAAAIKLNADPSNATATSGTGGWEIWSE